MTTTHMAWTDLWPWGLMSLRLSHCGVSSSPAVQQCQSVRVSCGGEERADWCWRARRTPGHTMSHHSTTSSHRAPPTLIMFCSQLNITTFLLTLPALHQINHCGSGYKCYLRCEMWQHSSTVGFLQQTGMLYNCLSLQPWRTLIVLNIYLPKSSSSHSSGSLLYSLM